MPDPAQTLDVKQLSTDELLDHLVNGRQAMAALKTQDEALLDRLSELVEQGELDPGGFTHQDRAFSWSAGRKSWAYPVEVQELEAQTKAAKKASEADGSAVATTGSPFWTIKPPKKP
jgi:hypothetical protein